MKQLRILVVICLACLASCQSSKDRFVEKDGVLTIEMESLAEMNNWEIKDEVEGFTGSGYITWTGDEHFNDSSLGRLEYVFEINNPGKYIFKWYSRVGKGDNNTEHNDTWLKISGVHKFYGERTDGNIVRPHGVCTDDCPKGSGHDGYFKVYGGYHDRWAWNAATSDHDEHEIVVEINTPGKYTIEIAARSSWHLIDKMMLYNSDMKTFEDAIAE